MKKHRPIRFEILHHFVKEKESWEKYTYLSDAMFQVSLNDEDPFKRIRLLKDEYVYSEDNFKNVPNFENFWEPEILV